MSRLYSTISGDGRAASRTRCANREVSASAQSHEGSITASILIRADGSHLAILEVAAGESKTGGREVWRGELSELVSADRLEVRP